MWLKMLTPLFIPIYKHCLQSRANIAVCEKFEELLQIGWEGRTNWQDAGKTKKVVQYGLKISEQKEKIIRKEKVQWKEQKLGKW